MTQEKIISTLEFACEHLTFAKGDILTLFKGKTFKDIPLQAYHRIEAAQRLLGGVLIALKVHANP